MIAKNNYTYPDKNDEITIAMINKIEKQKGKGYWQKSELRIINKMIKTIKQLIKKEGKTSFLDSGCGDGRLTPKFEPYFDFITLLDPDAKRIKIAKNLIKKEKFIDKVEFEVIPLESINYNNKFDVILCSHVLQHVYTDNVSIILKNIKNALKTNGLFFITTCNSLKNDDYYTKQYLKNSHLIEKVITKEEFNYLINKNNVLPIHYFTKKNITNLLNNLEFNILDFKTFHLKRDMYISASLEKLR